ncbi:sulfite exporter TauE/SafE family protein [Hydrogenophaga sp.]|uniref:sulfite exporter TauE/SafE family protein n=1 Tax=Hydrogenophaga sp. TaxID=1904254 RepID=UPI002618E657|nr:sulfite exporter TauE/SafE family protein [Hydrogenophaga sp.]MCW5654286.1 sulfite exporter TauE/SafE family protein [Hydrogenophaga sp.]
MTPELGLLLLGAAVAGFVQGLSGFAFGMVAMSFWVWGVEPRVAAVMAVFGSLTGQVVAAVSSRRGLRLGTLAPFLAGGAVGIPLGIAVLPLLNADLFRLVLGGVLVVFCPTMLLAPSLPKVARGARAGDALAGAVGGFMGGIGGFTGVVPTLWCTLRGMAKDEQRAVIQNFNLAALAFTMAGYVASGLVTRDLWPLMPLVALALLVPSLLGARLYVGLSELAFRRLVLSLLTLSGLAMLWAALPRLLHG